MGISKRAKSDVVRGKGTKDDFNKPKLTLTDPEFWLAVTEVMKSGAGKYKRGNWQKDLEAERLLNALLRHVIAIWQGEEFDKESGLRHSAHIGCNAMFLSYCERHGKPVITEHNKG